MLPDPWHTRLARDSHHAALGLCRGALLVGAIHEDTIGVDWANPRAAARALLLRYSRRDGTSGHRVGGVQTLRATLAIHEAAEAARSVDLPPTQNTAITTDEEVR